MEKAGQPDSQLAGELASQKAGKLDRLTFIVFRYLYVLISRGPDVRNPRYLDTQITFNGMALNQAT